MSQRIYKKVSEQYEEITSERKLLREKLQQVFDKLETKALGKEDMIEIQKTFSQVSQYLIDSEDELTSTVGRERETEETDEKPDVLSKLQSLPPAIIAGITEGAMIFVSYEAKLPAHSAIPLLLMLPVGYFLTIVAGLFISLREAEAKKKETATALLTQALLIVKKLQICAQVLYTDQFEDWFNKIPNKVDPKKSNIQMVRDLYGRIQEEQRLELLALAYRIWTVTEREYEVRTLRRNATAEKLLSLQEGQKQ